MTLKEIKLKVLGLIEELNTDEENLTEDPDIALKLNDVINQVQFELARNKKIPRYEERTVTAGDLIDFKTVGAKCSREVYQFGTVKGIRHEFKADGTIIKCLESGTAEIDFFVYPKMIDSNTPDTYEFDLSQDVLEILPYGVAADLLKSDVSTEYGSIYATRYESMLQRLDPRYHLTSVYIEGGVDI